MKLFVVFFADGSWMGKLLYLGWGAFCTMVGELVEPWIETSITIGLEKVSEFKKSFLRKEDTRIYINSL